MVRQFLMIGVAAAGLFLISGNAQAQWGCGTSGFGNRYGSSYYGNYSSPYGNTGYGYSRSNWGYGGFSPSYNFNYGQSGYRGGHYDYHAPSLYRHRGHVDVQPGHYDYHH